LVLERGLLYKQSGHEDMEGNFQWASSNYPYGGDDASQEFDGDPERLFYLWEG